MRGVIPSPSQGQIELIRALYADGLIAATLARHGIPQVPRGGPVWQRFPGPVPLSGEPVADLCWRWGQGSATSSCGQPVETARAFMRRSGIPMRHPGGRTPFLRRWQAARRRERG